MRGELPIFGWLKLVATFQMMQKAERERSVWIGWEGSGPFCELWLSLDLQAIGGQQPANAETEGASGSGTWRRESSPQRA